MIPDLSLDVGLIAICVAFLSIAWGTTRDHDARKNRMRYIHAIKEIEYLYYRLGMKYEKPPLGFGSTKEVKEYQVK